MKNELVILHLNIRAHKQQLKDKKLYGNLYLSAV